MKKGVAYVVVGLLAYIAFIVVMFPADRAYSYIKDTIPAATLYGITGTLWSGQAKAIKVDDNIYRSFQWKIKPWSVILGRIDVWWSFDNGDEWANGTAGFNLNEEVLLSNVEAQFPTSKINELIPTLPVELLGVLSVELDDALFDIVAMRFMEVYGTLTWNNANLPVISKAPLGNFSLHIETNEEFAITGLLEDNGEGPLSANGELQLNPDDSYQFNATFSPRDPKQTDLARGLRWLGRPDAQGQVSVNYSGTL